VTAELPFLAFLFLVTRDSVRIFDYSRTIANAPRNGPAKTDGDPNLCCALALSPAPPRGAGPS